MNVLFVGGTGIISMEHSRRRVDSAFDALQDRLAGIYARALDSV